MKERVVYGKHAVLEAIEAGQRIRRLYVATRSNAARDPRLAKALATQNVKVSESPREALDRLAEGGRHQGIVAVLSGGFGYWKLPDLLEKSLAAEKNPILVACDQITDPHNLGAIVRSAVAFGADGVLTLKNRAAPVTPVVVRASAGATEHARIVRVTNLARTLADLVDQGMDAIGLDAEGDLDMDDLPPAPGGRVIVVGAEGQGLRRLVRERCTHLARIAHPGPVASLNASVAASIALFCAWRARHPA
ncbi:MAG: 23S rRNA (guanosine(2251)-2'-O)-methyltransferase RlmB [Myxococcales bacterium]|nr:23S rRNA (guanosine(2251)-2'-O)-methyltransferase RlmB [Myxococcales bacterium]